MPEWMQIYKMMVAWMCLGVVSKIDEFYTCMWCKTEGSNDPIGSVKVRLKYTIYQVYKYIYIYQV